METVDPRLIQRALVSRIRELEMELIAATAFRESWTNILFGEIAAYSWDQISLELRNRGIAGRTGDA